MLFKENDKAIYLQIADAICDGILAGLLLPGSRIPSAREYAASVEVNANTVMRSYDYLASKEIIFNKRGIGYFIADDAPEKVSGIRREELLDGELDSIFRRLRLLDITPEELSSLYSRFITSQNTITDIEK